jgi:hypothetical protein
VLVGPGFLIVSLAGMLVTAIPFMVLHVKSLSVISWLANTTSIVASFAVVVTSVLILGRDRTGSGPFVQISPADQRSDGNWVASGRYFLDAAASLPFRPSPMGGAFVRQVFAANAVAVF